MDMLLSPAENNRQYEEPKFWLNFLHTNIETLANATNLPISSLSRKDRIRSPKVQSRLRDVHAILISVSPWFQSMDAAWLWFRSAPLPGFNNMSPSEVLSIYGDEGVAMIQKHIRRKKFGGFA